MTILRIPAILLALAVLAGCQSTPHKEEDPSTIWGVKVDAPAGPDGLTVQDKRDLDLLRQELALNMSARLGEAQEIEIRDHHPVRRPTVAVKYTGRPPKGLFLDMDEQLAAYQSSYMVGDTIVYNTDLAKMTMIMERQKDGEPYDFREVTTTVPYGLCLDFIQENLGKESKGYIMRRVECTQDGLGFDY